MDRLLRGAGGTLTLETYDSAGALADVDGNNVPTVVVRDSAGTTVLTPVATRTAAGTYTTPVVVTLTVLDLYDVTWTWPNAATRTSEFEVVGTFLFSDSELRAFDADLDAVTYPPAKVRDVREAVEARFEVACGVSFTRRGRRELLDGDNTGNLFLDERRVLSVVSVGVDATALDVSTLTTYQHGRLYLSTGWGGGYRNVSVLYEYGFATPPPPVKDAGMRYARYLLVPGANKNDERITGISMDVGFARFSMPGKDAPTGIPDVDAVLAQYDYSGNLA